MSGKFPSRFMVIFFEVFIYKDGRFLLLFLFVSYAENFYSESVLAGTRNFMATAAATAFEIPYRILMKFRCS